jgi:saccharopine dehydrogenase-like NADP-dependent oxidoreductase
MRVAVLGAGRVGATIALDLARDYHVTVADRDRGRLDMLERESGLVVQEADLADPQHIGEAVARADLVIGAVPGHMGFTTLTRVIDAGKNVVDISFFAEDGFELDERARRAGVTAVVDCGVAPGLSNLVLGRMNESLDEVTGFTCYVGGLPQERKPPWEYQAPFSPIDVIEEYTRPARLVRDGEVLVLPALSERELLDFDEVGSLEAFNTDGLRSLIKTMRIPDMAEKTLRYPGHLEKIITLRDAGLFGRSPVRVGDHIVRPIDLTSQVLMEQWLQRAGDRDLTVMRLIVDGRESGQTVRRRFDLLDYYDEATATTSMARTTGYTCAVVARLVLEGTYRRPGISPPEFVGASRECYDMVLHQLAARGVRLVGD